VNEHAAESVVLDASTQVASNGNSTAASDDLDNTRSRAVATLSGGYVTSPDTVSKQGNVLKFPPGAYMCKLVITDEKGLIGTSMIGVHLRYMEICCRCTLDAHSAVVSAHICSELCSRAI
jgi:hypothetical protein